MDGWQKGAFFYSVPPVSQESRFFNEVVETGDMLWRDWRNIGVERHHDKLWKTMVWQPFKLANTQLRMEMKMSWAESKGRTTLPRLEVIMTPLESLKGNFNLMLAFAMWNPGDVQQFVSKHRYIPKYTLKPRHPVVFENAVELQGEGAKLPVRNIVDMKSRCNAALYVRLEVPNQTIYPITGPSGKNRAIANGPGVLYQMENKGHDSQDSTLFEYKGARWRLFYQRKPTTMLLLQRMPMDDPREEIGEIELEFDLVCVRNNGNYFKESLVHTFRTGFNDWGEENPNFRKAEWFVARLNALRVEQRGPQPPQIYGAPPPGPPPGQEKGDAGSAPPSGDFGPPPGPPPGNDGPNAGGHNEVLPEYSLQ